MTKHQKLTLIRYTKGAILRFEQALQDTDSTSEQATTKGALTEANEMFQWLKDMPTSD